MPLDDPKKCFPVDRFGQKRVCVDDLVASRRDDHRDASEIGIALLHLAKLPTIHYRHHQIENDRIWSVPGAQDLERMLAVIRDEYAVVVLLEHGGYLIPNVAVILDD